MNLQSLLQDFNPSKFTVYLCLLVFSMALALRLDGRTEASYWLIFTPLWLWKGLVVVGALAGSLIWVRNPQFRLSDSSYIHFKSMLISLSLQLLLLMFELLVCDKLESRRHLWILAFIPLIFISLLSIAISIWALKNDRGFEMELFCSVNILQFIFIALRLDGFISWSWVVVLVPMWIIMCLAVIGLLYALIFSAILLRTPEVAIEQRKASLHSAVSYSLIIVPMIIFLILLSSKLDSVDAAAAAAGHRPRPNLSSSDHNRNHSHHKPPMVRSEMSYFAVCIPLYFTFVILICLSFESRGGNLWWFGMRKDFCTFLLSVCPCLREYGNISYNKHCNGVNNNNGSSNNPEVGGDSIDAGARKLKELANAKAKKKAVVPHITIESPD